jgi:hypothetical protein
MKFLGKKSKGRKTMNEMLMNTRREPRQQPIVWVRQEMPWQDMPHQAPRADEHDALVQRFRDRNETYRRRENLFGCVMR